MMSKCPGSVNAGSRPDFHGTTTVLSLPGPAKALRLSPVMMAVLLLPKATWALLLLPLTVTVLSLPTMAPAKLHDRSR